MRWRGWRNPRHKRRVAQWIDKLGNWEIAKLKQLAERLIVNLKSWKLHAALGKKVWLKEEKKSNNKINNECRELQKWHKITEK